MEQVLRVVGYLVAAHVIGDFGLQNAWMNAEKGKNWEVLSYHALVVTVLLPLMSDWIRVSWAAMAVTFATHFLIDALKARYGVLRTIWQDQVCHLVVMVVLAAAGLVTLA